MAGMEVNIHKAKTYLSSLLQRVAAGEEIIIARAGVPVARVVPVEPERGPRPLAWIEGDLRCPRTSMLPCLRKYSHPSRETNPQVTDRTRRGGEGINEVPAGYRRTG